MTESRLRSDVKTLATSSAIYTAGTAVTKGLPFLLLPLYTRYLTPADYGILAFASAVGSVLAVLYTLSLHGSVTYLFFKTDSETERRRSIGTVWLTLVSVATAAAFLADATGHHFSGMLSQEVPFDPYIRLAVWIGLFNVLSLVPLNLLQVEGKPARYVLVAICAALANATLIIWFVVFRGQGAYGSLLGTLIAAALISVPYLAITVRRINFAIDRKHLKVALVYSLPLVPHSIAGWLLELSDRVILERFVSLESLGLYSIAYLLSSAVYLFAVTINNGLIPLMFKRIASGAQDARYDIARLSTYFVAAVCWAMLGIVLLDKAVLAVFTTPAFYGAADVMPWIAAGMLMQSLYLIPVNVLFARSRTWTIALVTMTAGIANVALNLWWVPQLGILGAAWATCAGYTLMLLLVWAASQRVYSLPYEYPRIAKLFIAAAAIFALSRFVEFPGTLADTVFRLALWLLFPVSLLALGFYHSREIQIAGGLVQRVFRRS